MKNRFLIAVPALLLFASCQSEQPEKKVVPPLEETIQKVVINADSAHFADSASKAQDEAAKLPPPPFIPPMPVDPCPDCPGIEPEPRYYLDPPLPDTVAVIPDVRQEDEVVEFCEKTPSFPGGDTARQTFFRKNLKYPEAEKEMNIQGTIYLRFIVEKDGSLTNFEIVKSVGGGPGLSKEALRVAKMMPAWTPGENGGKAVRCRYIIPVKFRLD